MKFKFNSSIVFFIFLMVVGGYVVFTFTGEKSHTIQSPIQPFVNSETLLANVSKNMNTAQEKSPVYFLGVDPDLPNLSELIQKWLIFENESGRPFQAVVVDEALSTIVKLESTKITMQESFHFHKSPDRLIGGIKSAIEKKIRLLVVVLNADAIRSRTDSLAAQAVTASLNINSLILAKFPRSREEEKNFSLPCNTGEEDRAMVASLGCYVLQRSRHWYNKKLLVKDQAAWIAELDLLLSGEYLLMLSPVVSNP